MAILVERDHIGIFGRMNAGKSSLMNLLTQQGTSIVDATPGTTTDTNIALQELHGLGPVKLYDTAGADEQGELGDKKKGKVWSDLKECDLVLLVIASTPSDGRIEEALLSKARELDKQVLVVYNMFSEDAAAIPAIEKAIPLLRFHKKIAITATDPGCRQDLLEFIIRHFRSKRVRLPLLPFLRENEYYVLVIPMDIETPPGRYLRPQAMVEEEITRGWSYPVSFRLDLAKARSSDKDVVAGERERFLGVVNGLHRKPKAIITDSQAMDVMGKWCPPDVQLTTFSIVMINHMSGGRLQSFVEGLNALGRLRAGDRVLIAEACNHSRIGEDIGTVQIPSYLGRQFPGVEVEHSFGGEFQSDKALDTYSLIIHCGGCMISSQKLAARLRDLEGLGVPFTNYGLVLSYMQGAAALAKVLEPWGLKAP